VLYEAVRENLATLLAEASEVGCGLPRYVERDFSRYLEWQKLTLFLLFLREPGTPLDNNVCERRRRRPSSTARNRSSTEAS
jgi:hypothetical protein